MNTGRLFYILILFSASLVSCSDDNNPNDKEYPGSVTFVYDGNTVTYNVIKKTYFKDANGNVLQKGITKLWLDRNLGAQRAATGLIDTLAMGDLFQWGRPADGHQKRKSDTAHKLSENIVPGHNKFIVKPLYANDWLINSNDLLWNGPANENCSCPEGWRVPTIEELLMEMYSWTTMDMKGANASELKWVPSGNRDNHGTERYWEYWSFIWSSTPRTNGSAKALAIPGSLPAEAISSTRIFGLTVRCIKDY